MSELPPITSVAERLRDSALENELSRLLRGVSDEERERFLVALLRDNRFSARMAALSLVRRTVTSKESLRRIFLVGLERKDVSEIGAWLRAIVPRMGINAILLTLAGDAVRADHIVRCWYQLQPYVKNKNITNDVRIVEKVQELKDKVRERYSELSEEEKEACARYEI